MAAKLRFAALTSSHMNPGDAPIAMPTGVIGFEGLALFKSDVAGELVFDAAKLARKSAAGVRVGRPKEQAKVTDKAVRGPRGK